MTLRKGDRFHVHYPSRPTLHGAHVEVLNPEVYMLNGIRPNIPAVTAVRLNKGVHIADRDRGAGGVMIPIRCLRKDPVGVWVARLPPPPREG